MGLTIDVVWSFRSPYSYLATPARAPRGRVRRGHRHPRRPADCRPHPGILRHGVPLLAALPSARRDAHRGVRGDSVWLAAARPDRAGLRDPEGRPRPRSTRTPRLPSDSFAEAAPATD